MSETHFLDLPPDRMEGEVAVVFFFEDDRPLHGAASLLDWRLNGRMTELLLSGAVTGRLGDVVVFRNNGKLDADWALLMGGGKRERLSVALWERLLKKAIKVCQKAGFERVAFSLDSQADVPMSQIRKVAENLLGELRDTPLECLFSFDTVPVLATDRSDKQTSLL